MNTKHDSSIPQHLKIMQVASAFTSWGGMEIHLLNLAQQLEGRGHRVVVAAQPGKWVEKRAQSLGLETFPATVLRQQDWTEFKHYRDFLRDGRFDVVHTHTNWDAVVPAAAARLAGVPVSVMTWHLPFPFKDRRGGNLILSGLYRRMIAISGSVRDRHIAHGVDPRKVEVIHHGTDTAAFRNVSVDRETLRDSLGLLPTSLTIGIIGRVSPEKGHSDLIEAVHLLAAVFPELFVVVVGDGPDVPRLREWATRLGLADKVIFTGFRDDVNNVISALDIVAVPSSWHEPCSAAIQQAMALSKPVIGSRMGGTPEIIVDGETGLLVPASHPPALAEALAAMASDSTLRAKMGAAGAARAESHFTLSHMTDQVEAMYYRELSLRPSLRRSFSIPR